ncbi:peptidoglycan-binding protein [Hazenella sp. IB182357]|uniref:Peptidoglycan-binding protein n=1 Tax=Polycladospora coralii TaxID=2771432 RepID=A0A926RVC5_9BACL|nr:peptidoglycan-binding protein [Polycladospora coralii]
MNNLGWPGIGYHFVIESDGVYGLNTNQAVLEFQRAFGLAIDGVVGNETRNTLNNPPYKRLLKRGSEGGSREDRSA